MKINEMEGVIEESVKLLVERITYAIKPDHALQFTQAALNLEHVLAVRDNIEQQRKREQSIQIGGHSPNLHTEKESFSTNAENTEGSENENLEG